jgi:hypothetical protein
MIVARGIHRIRDGFVTQHSVLVDYGDSTHEIPEDLYRRHGYQPPFEQLPWQDEDEGDAARPPASESAHGPNPMACASSATSKQWLNPPKT